MKHTCEGSHKTWKIKKILWFEGQKLNSFHAIFVIRNTPTFLQIGGTPRWDKLKAMTERNFSGKHTLFFRSTWEACFQRIILDTVDHYMLNYFIRNKVNNILETAKMLRSELDRNISETHVKHNSALHLGRFT